MNIEQYKNTVENTDSDAVSQLLAIIGTNITNGSYNEQTINMYTVHKWIQCDENADLFFTKYLPTERKKLKFMQELAKHGLLPLIQWAQNNGCPWDKYACVWAARNGHLDVLQWAGASGCPEKN